MHVAEEGRRTEVVPVWGTCWMQGGGVRVLKPRRGRREQLVMNFRNFRWEEGGISSTTAQSHWTTGWEGW